MSDTGVGASLTFVFADDDLARAEAQGVQDVPKHSKGVVRELEEERVFAFDWENELIRMELIAEKDGCRLIFTHVFDRDRAQAPRNAGGWHTCLDALEAALSKKPTTERNVDELVKSYTLAMEGTKAFKNHPG